MPWISFRELRRVERERREALDRARSSEIWARGLVNSLLTSRQMSGVPVAAGASPEKTTPTPRLPDVVQGWTKEEFIAQTVTDGTHKSQAEALEAWKAAQQTGKFAYQKDEEFVS